MASGAGQPRRPEDRLRPPLAPGAPRPSKRPRRAPRLHGLCLLASGDGSAGPHLVDGVPPQPAFEQRVNSRLCYADLAGGRPRTVRGHRNVLYPTPVDSAGLAWVEYNPDGRYVIVRRRPGWGVQRYEMERLTELHGLAWDNATGRLYFLVTDDSGMWIGTLDDFGRVRHVTEGALCHPKRSAGRRRPALFRLHRFGQGRSPLPRPGKRTAIPAHILALRLLLPSPDAQGDVLVTTYDRRATGPPCSRSTPCIRSPMRGCPATRSIRRASGGRWSISTP